MSALTSTNKPTDYDYEDKFQEALKKITSNSLKHKLIAIKNIIVVRLGLEKQFKGLHHKLEAKYDNLYKPIYEKRAKVIEGTEEVSVDQIKEQLEKIKITDVNAINAEKGIPEFWLKCLKNSSQFGHVINKNDEKVLASLQDLNSTIDESGSFKLNFVFNANPYFDHQTLTRHFELDPHNFSVTKITSTKIEWKSEDLDPTVEKKNKVIKNKKKGTKKTVTKLEEVPSFFGFFKNYDLANANKKDADKDEDDVEEEEEDEAEIIEEEYDIGLFVKEELIPYAIEYYLGIIKEDVDDEGEDFEDEEDEEPEETPKGKKGKKY